MLGPLAVFLAIELLDELVFGIREAAWPAIRADLGISYALIGVLLTVPALIADSIEPWLALATGHRRRTAIAAGGVAFAAGLVVIALAGNYMVLLIAFIVLYPASGAFVSLTQATLMDLEPARHEANMARWTLAGSVGVVLGPLALVGATRLGLGWRPLFLVCALLSLPLAFASRAGGPGLTPAATPFRAALRMAAMALRNRGVLRWLVLLHVTDLLGDILAGFLALYFVDVVHVPVSDAAFAVVLWTVAGLIGDALLIPLLDRISGLTYLRISSLAMLIIYPALLLVPGFPAKLVLLGVVSLLRAGWYAVPQGRLYSELQGESNVALAVSNIAGLIGGTFPLVIGLIAARWGLGSALWLGGIAPIALLIGLRGSDSIQRGEELLGEEM